MEQPHNLSHGAALKRGIPQAHSEWIVNADGTYPAESIPDLWKERENYDMVGVIIWAVGLLADQNSRLGLDRGEAWND